MASRSAQFSDTTHFGTEFTLTRQLSGLVARPLTRVFAQLWLADPHPARTPAPLPISAQLPGHHLDTVPEIHRVGTPSVLSGITNGDREISLMRRSSNDHAGVGLQTSG